MSKHKNPVPIMLSADEKNALHAIRVDVGYIRDQGGPGEGEKFEQLHDCITEHLKNLSPQAAGNVIAALVWIGAESLTI